MQVLLHFVYLPAFESSARGLLDEEARRRLEKVLLENPDAGVIIGRSGGVRKLRVAVGGRGKSGGARVIYYYRPSVGRVYLLLAYAKSEAANLSNEGKAIMRTLVERLERES